LSITKRENIPNNNFFPSATVSGSSESSLNRYHLSCEDKEYQVPETVVETTPGPSDRTKYLMMVEWLHSNSPSE